MAETALKNPTVLLALKILKGGGAPVVFDVSYQAVIDYATLQGFGLPSPPNQIKQNSLVVDLKSAGVWDELDVFYNFYTDGDHNFAKINWKAPGTVQVIGTGHEPLFTINDGFKGGSPAYLNTQFVNTVARLGQAGNVSVFADVGGFTSDGGRAFGVAATTVQLELIPYFPGAGGTRMITWGSPGQIQLPNIASGNAFVHLQSLSTVQRKSVNGVPGPSVAYTAGMDAANPIFLLASNGGALAPFGYGNGTIRCFGSGTKLEGKELALFNAWSTYKTQNYGTANN